MSLQVFPQPKAIRDNSAYYRQETFYPGTSGNALAPQNSFVIHRPILPPTIQVNPIPLSVSLEQQPIIVSVPADNFVDTSVVRSAQNRKKVVGNSQVFTTEKPRTTTEPATPEEIEEQSKSAYYKFGTSVHDTINDHEHVREEVREGLALKGMYSYSDGFFRRTVHYQADENGYRVLKEEIEAIGDGEGPKFNPKGTADVKSTLAGDYSIQVGDFRLNKKQEQQVNNS